MRRLKLRRPADPVLLLRASLLVAAIRLGLTTLPFRLVRRVAHKVSVPRGLHAGDGPVDVHRIGRAVERVSRFIPGATCLTQALSASILLAWYGADASVHIGVARDSEQKLTAHAWVTSRGSVIVGGSDLGRFQPLVIMKRDHA